MRLSLSFLFVVSLLVQGCTVAVDVETEAVTETALVAPMPSLLDTGGVTSDLQAAYRIEWYEIRTTVEPETQSIAGASTIRFTALAPLSLLELNFDAAFEISAITHNGKALAFERVNHALYVDLGRTLAVGEVAEVTTAYRGVPHVAKRPPWQGGFTWSETEDGFPWVATSFQFEGCDIWWPCKDHPSAEPRGGVDVYITVPAGLTAVSNGNLVEEIRGEAGATTFHWQTRYPINLYGISLNVGPYVHLQKTVRSINGDDVDIHFWPLASRENAARALFDAEFEDTFHWFERTLGPFPWGDDKMGVVETPFLGMEHQSVNAYGNEYRRDKYGFDWLFHHELAHEWFGNLMSVHNNADLWLHEGTASYIDSLRAADVMGITAHHAAIYGTYLSIRACAPVVLDGQRSGDDVYFDKHGGPAGDIYTKGAWVLRSLRFLIGDEPFWRTLRTVLYGVEDPLTLSRPYQPRFSDTDEFRSLVAEATGDDLDWFFEVYLKRGPLPVLASRQDGDDLVLNWENTGDVLFPMPLPVMIDGESQRLPMTGGTHRIAGGVNRDVVIDPEMQVLRKLPVVPTCEERRAEEAAAEAARAEAS